MTTHRPIPPAGTESAPAGTGSAAGEVVEVVRSEERLSVGTATSELSRVRVSRRIVTETVTVEVQVRREELVVEELPGTPGTPVARTTDVEPLVVVLRREVPQPGVRVEPYEQVTLSVVRVAGEQQVSDTLRHEVVDIVETGAEGSRAPVRDV